MDNFTIIVDTREQAPFKFKEQKVITKKLDTGDYSVMGFESVIAIERKSGSDFLGSITTGRERFKDCLLRLQGLERGYIIVEGELTSLMDGVEIKRAYKTEAGIKPKVKQTIGIHPNSLFGTVVSIMTRYHIPIIFSKNRKEAERFTLEILKKFYKIKRLND
ncbi:MAG: ERCC4 domain-containing protein [Flavobacterium sp.]|nr:ERCC4 domain-containing protein [Flavobacterium sp.]